MGDMPTTDGHGQARKRGVITSYACGEKSKLSKLGAKRIQKSTVQCKSVRFSGQNITAERGSSEGDVPTTDEHGQPRKRGTYNLLLAALERSKLSQLKIGHMV